MKNHYDVIVVGAGAMGMSAGYHLARRGMKTLMIDADDPPHRNGTHHGETRLIRRAYREGRAYTPMALRAQQLWRELDQESARPLFRRTGLLQVGVPGSRMIAEMIASANRYNLPLEIMSGREIMQRWPGIRVADQMIGCYEPDSGVLLCEACVGAYRQAAAARGAELLVHSPVRELLLSVGGAEVVTAADARYTADALVVTAGKFAGDLLRRIGLRIPLSPTRKAVAWFQADEALYEAGTVGFPAFLFEVSEGFYYGFPSMDGSGVKVGRHDGELPIHPEEPLAPFGTYPEDVGDVTGFMRRYMAGASEVMLKGDVCTYTRTADEHFVLDRHPQYPHVVIGAGFSGHEFMFASVVGEMLSKLAAGEKPGLDISLFSISRFQQSCADRQSGR